MRVKRIMHLGLISMFLAGSPTFSADSGSDTYEKVAFQYVLASGIPVEAVCDSGDSLVKGDCHAAEKFPDPEREKAIYLQSAALSEKAGWGCQTSHQDVRQLLRIVARAVCKRKS